MSTRLIYSGDTMKAQQLRGRAMARLSDLKRRMKLGDLMQASDDFVSPTGEEISVRVIGVQDIVVIHVPGGDQSAAYQAQTPEIAAGVEPGYMLSIVYYDADKLVSGASDADDVFRRRYLIYRPDTGNHAWVDAADMPSYAAMADHFNLTLFREFGVIGGEPDKDNDCGFTEGLVSSVSWLPETQDQRVIVLPNGATVSIATTVVSVMAWTAADRGVAYRNISAYEYERVEDPTHVWQPDRTTWIYIGYDSDFDYDAGRQYVTMPDGATQVYMYPLKDEAIGTIRQLTMPLADIPRSWVPDALLEVYDAAGRLSYPWYRYRAEKWQLLGTTVPGYGPCVTSKIGGWYDADYIATWFPECWWIWPYPVPAGQPTQEHRLSECAVLSDPWPAEWRNLWNGFNMDTGEPTEQLSSLIPYTSWTTDGGYYETEIEYSCSRVELGDASAANVTSEDTVAVQAAQPVLYVDGTAPLVGDISLSPSGSYGWTVYVYLGENETLRFTVDEDRSIDGFEIYEGAPPDGLSSDYVDISMPMETRESAIPEWRLTGLTSEEVAELLATAEIADGQTIPEDLEAILSEEPLALDGWSYQRPCQLIPL